MIMNITCIKSIEIAAIRHLDVKTSINPLVTIDNDIHSHYQAPRDVKGFYNACVYSADGDSSPSSNHASTARPSAAR